MVTKYDKVQNAQFKYTSENHCMVLGDTFENKSLRSGSIILLNDSSIKDLEVILAGKYTLFGDDGTDIMCNWNGYPLLIQ
ncbi:4274_t:CDS:2, partial [Cetraspora pellucida]